MVPAADGRGIHDRIILRRQSAFVEIAEIKLLPGTMLDHTFAANILAGASQPFNHEAIVQHQS